MSFVEVCNFSYTYPGEQNSVLQDINLSLNRGDFVVITGKSGCGKSTLGKALAGFLFQNEKPNFSGTITINQEDITKIPLYEAIEKVAYVQQNPEDQFCTLTVLDEIAFGLENLCVEPNGIENRIEQALITVQGIDLKGRELASLSGGEKQKVAISSLLALDPDVLILDEPTSNLDPNATQTIFQTLFDLHQNNELTVIIIEHKLEQLLRFSPKIFALENGTLNRRDIPPVASMISLQEQHQNESPPIAQHDTTFINFQNINISIQDSQILKNINLNVCNGEFIALMGPNGSGKSTLLRTIMGFHKPSSGEGTVFSQDIFLTKTSSLVENVGFIFQNPDHQLFTQSVWEELIFTSINLGIINHEIEADAQQLLSMMDLTYRKDDNPQRLSYGEKRRLNLAASMLHKPKLLLVDELLIGQDNGNAQIWMTLLHDYTKIGNSVILVNHHANLTRKYCDRIVFMDQGTILIDHSITKAFEEMGRLGYGAFMPSEEQVLAYA